jgi:hypothetical protein
MLSKALGEGPTFPEGGAGIMYPAVGIDVSVRNAADPSRWGISAGAANGYDPSG